MKRKFTKLMAALALLLFIAPPMVGWGQTYKKVTSAPSNWSGEYLLVYENNSTTAYVWTGVDESSCYASTTISSGVVTKPDNAVSITLASMTGGYSLQVNGGTNDGKYTQNNGNSNGIKFVDSGVANTLTYENSATTISCGGKKFRYNKTSGQYRFRYFGSDQEKVQLYKKAYTVTYDANGGTGTMTDSNSPYFENSTVTTLTNTFEYVGQNFSGWNTAADGSGTSYDEGDEFTITANTTLYAQWQPAGNYIIVSPTIANVDEGGGNIEFSVSTDQTLGDNPVVFYETSEGTTTTTTPDWITEIIYMEGELVVTVATNTSVARTAYFKVENSTVQSDVVTVSQAAITVATPVFDVAAGTYYEDQLVDITCATSGATIRYTTDGTTPTANSTEYDGNGVTITESTTLKAIAIKNSVSSEVATATYTIIHPLTTMDAIFEAATNNGSTASNVNVTFGNWVVSGVSGSNVFVTDNSGKGFIIYKNDHGFTIDDKLSGTVMETPLKLYNGSAEFTNLTSSTIGLSVSHDGEITIITDKAIADLGGVNTGAVITLNNLTYDGTNLSDGTNTIKPYNTLYSGMSFTTGKTYNVTGVYQQFGNTKEILPRSANDIVEVLDPTISVNPSSAETFSYIVEGGPSEEQVFEVTGSFLTSDDIIVSVPEDCAFEITDNEEYGYAIIIGSGDAFSVRMKAGLEVSDEYSATLTITNDVAEPVYLPLTGSVTYAHVTYDGNGEGVTNVPTDNNNYSYSNQVTVLGAGEMTKEGYDFVWWTPTQDGSGDVAYEENDQFSITSDVTLYAQWEAKSYDITKAEMTNGDVTVKVGENVVTSATTGTTVTLVVAPAANYALNQLVVTKTGDPATTVAVTNNQFVMPAYPVTVSATFVEHYSKDIDFENDVATYSEWTFDNMTSGIPSDNDVTAHGGSKFGTTGGKSTASITTKNKIASPTSLTCYVSKKSNNTTSSSWSIQVSEDGNSWTTVGTQSATSMAKGEWVEFTRNLSSYSNVYVRVYYGSNTAVRCIDDLSLTYTPATSYALSVASVDHGTITATVGSTMVQEDGSLDVENLTVVTLNAEADENYQFNSWSVYKTGDPTTTVEVDANNQFTMPAYPVTVSASFVPTYALTYSVNGFASTVNVPAGSTFNLSAPTENIPANFNFVGWTTNPANVADADLITSIDMNADATVYAVFSKSNTITLNDSYFTGSYPSSENEYTVDGVKFGADKVMKSNGIQFKASEGYIYNKNAFVGLATIVATRTTSNYACTLLGGSSSNPIEEGTEIEKTTSNNVDTYTISGNYQYIVLKNQTGNAARYSSIVFNFAGDGARYTRVFNETAAANITIVGPSIIPSSSTLDMGSHSLGYAQGVSNLIIEDGGQLISHMGVQATMLKHITGTDFGSQANPTNAGYYLIASPLAVAPTTVNNMIATTNGDYDLYAFDPTAEMEWQNYKSSNFTLALGKGYLYANSNTTTLEFAGQLNSGFVPTNLNYVAGDDLHSLNLVGNPFAHEYDFVVRNGSTDADFNYLTLNATGDGFITHNTGTDAAVTLAPMQAILVQAPGADYHFADPNDMPGIIDDGEIEGLLNISVSRNRGASVGSTGIIDNALVSFGNAPLMKKIRLSDNATELCMLQGGEEMAVVRAQGQGELPVSFKASENGSYTLSIETKNVEMSYLHLIDNMTGADVDLLATPSYTFEAKTSDYASRFRLVFSASSISEDADGDSAFAYFNGSNWTISNMGEATLQVVDVMGRVLSSEQISGNTEININQPAGVYMLRLVSGDSVKVQKVVVR